MNTIAPRLTLATTTAARQLGHHHLAAAAAAAAMHGSGLVTVAFLGLAGLFIAALSSAARALASVLSELLRVAAAATSVMFAMVIVIFIGVALLAHH